MRPKPGDKGEFAKDVGEGFQEKARDLQTRKMVRTAKRKGRKSSRRSR